MTRWLSRGTRGRSHEGGLRRRTWKGTVFAWCRKTITYRERGFTLIELVVVLAILGILIALAVPRYLGARKKAYKAEADNLLQEAKTLEWAYYQQYDVFDMTGASIGFVMPGGSHWNPPSVSGTAASIQITMSGAQSPVGSTDSVWITLSSDGSSSGGSTF
jgi:prepilin-type N-terminal cleavage/methylation domain-containing protein